MAKNNDLFGFFLCLIAGLCIGIGGVALGVRFWALGDRTTGIDGVQQSAISCQPAPFRYAPVEKTADGEGTFDATSLNANLIRNKIKQIYSDEIGVREKTGKNDGERVEEYLAVSQLGKGYAWCAAFVSWVFAEAGFPEPRTPWSPSLFPKKRVIWERGREGVGPEILANRVENLNNKLMLLSNTHNLVTNTQSLLPNTHNLIPNTQYLVSNTHSLIPNTQYLVSNTHNLIPNTHNLIPATADVFGIYFANLKRIAHVGFVDEWGDKQVITVEGNTNEAGSAEGDGVYRKRRPIASIYQVANWVDLRVEQ